MEKKIYIRWAILAVLLVFIWTAMSLADVGEWYAQRIYPMFYHSLSRFSSLFPFSIGDCFIYGSIAGLLIFLVYSLVKKENIGKAIRLIIEYLAWVYVWFYMAWGINYFRHSFFTRAEITPVAYSAENFRHFLTTYTEGLNASFCEVLEVDTPVIVREVKQNYRNLPSSYHLLPPTDYLRAKPMLISSLMSSVGVKGYMGPFFIEYNLNRQLLPIEYAATYAHEMTHTLGITNEAEANLYAYLVCTASDVPEIRFSGYFSLFSYVLGNAYRVLSPEDFEAWKTTIRPEVRNMYNEKVRHWQSLYSPWIGEIQDKVYNLFLKGNNISSGTENYAEVIGLLISLEQSRKNNYR